MTRQMWALALFTTAIHTVPAAAQATQSMLEDGPREVVAERTASALIDHAPLSAYVPRLRLGTLQEETGLEHRPTATATAYQHPSEVGPFATYTRQAEAATIDLDDKIVVSTTAVVIGLLVLIVILVAAD